MATTGKLAGFTAGLAAVFAAALFVGSQVGAIGPAPAAHHGGAAHSDHLPGGLQTAQDGYRLVLDRTSLPPGQRSLAFTITGPDGEPVTSYVPTHERRLHLIAVRRDFAGFQHVHPTLGPDGTWRTALDLRAGTWRVFTDFRPSGEDEALVLGADLAVPGTVAAPEHAHVSRTSTVDGYTVRLGGHLRPGKTSTLTLTVTRAGVPVRNLQPYLGAYGHLVALRDGDLAYLHVHPEDGAAGPRIVFGAEVPSAGRYHLYLDFKHGGTVRTAHFTVDAGGGHHG